MEVFKRDVEENPSDPNPFDNLGDVYFLLGRIDSAIIAKKEAKAVSPVWASDVSLVYLYALKEDYEAAFKSVQRLQSDTAWGPGARFWKTFLDGWLGARTRSREGVQGMMEYQDRVTSPTSTASYNLRGYLSIGCVAMNVDRIDIARKCFSESFRYSRVAFPKDSAWYSAALKSQNAMADLWIGDIRSAESNIAQAKLSMSKTSLPNPSVSNAEADSG